MSQLQRRKRGHDHSSTSSRRKNARIDSDDDYADADFAGTPESTSGDRSLRARITTSSKLSELLDLGYKLKIGIDGGTATATVIWSWSPDSDNLPPEMTWGETVVHFDIDHLLPMATAIVRTEEGAALVFDEILKRQLDLGNIEEHDVFRHLKTMLISEDDPKFKQHVPSLQADKRRFEAVLERHRGQIIKINSTYRANGEVRSRRIQTVQEVHELLMRYLVDGIKQSIKDTLGLTTYETDELWEKRSVVTYAVPPAWSTIMIDQVYELLQNVGVPNLCITSEATCVLNSLAREVQTQRRRPGEADLQLADLQNVNLVVVDFGRATMVIAQSTFRILANAIRILQQA
jgi:hypothetical protein